MGVIRIESEADGTTECFVVPIGGAVTIPEFGGPGIKEHAVEGDAEGPIGRTATVAAAPWLEPEPLAALLWRCVCASPAGRLGLGRAPAQRP